VWIRLLFFLVPVLFYDTSLHAAFGPASRCLPPAALRTTAETVDVTLPISELGSAIPHYDSKDRDLLIRTMVFEASGEPEEGKAAVAFVILNRERSGRWGDDIEEVVRDPWQFEPWMTQRSEMEKLSRSDPRYESAASIADAVLSGQMSDPTAGATHFLNPVVVRQRRGGSLPTWARGDGKPIGRHTFYSPSEGDAEPKQPSMSALANPLSCEGIEDKRRNTQLETFGQMAGR
jgi:spore germination cell wall hydrolase CwlJ-like protein